MRRVRLLFVCVENSCRSQMAEALARRLGGSSVEAYSAGSKPLGRVNPGAVEAMREIGVDLSGQSSKGLSGLPSGTFDAVVTMGCGDACPAVPAGLREDWPVEDPKGQGPEAFRRVRDDLEARIRGLLKVLGLRPPPASGEGRRPSP